MSFDWRAFLTYKDEGKEYKYAAGKKWFWIKDPAKLKKAKENKEAPELGYVVAELLKEDKGLSTVRPFESTDVSRLIFMS